MKLAICVPYRNREEHLKQFIPYMHAFLSKRKYDFKIFICHQVDDKLFNRGRMKNIAFDIAKKEGYDFFAFHDIDLLPEDDSCDYSYPNETPVHVSSYLSMYDYNLVYPENFGGVVLFTKEQFEKVNGYYNDYWNWGMEDDDLYWRCMQNGYTKINEISRPDKNKNVLVLKETSSIIIPTSSSIDEMLAGSFTISFLLKLDERGGIPNCIFGDPTSDRIHIPILSCSNKFHLFYSNSNDYIIGCENNSSQAFFAWHRHDKNHWANITITYCEIKKKISLYVNGREAGDGNNEDLKADISNLSGLDMHIGLTNDLKEWNYPLVPLKGQISNIQFWKKSMNLDDIKESIINIDHMKDDVVLSVDFEEIENGNVIDNSGNNNHCLIQNCRMIKTSVGSSIDTILPVRRNGRFKCLPHESEGWNNNSYKQKESIDNENVFLNKVKKGIVDFKENGISNLSYELIGRRKIMNQHEMVDVKL